MRIHWCFHQSFSLSLLLGLIHVEIELHAHRQMLRELTEQRKGNHELRKAVAEHDEKIEALFKKILHNDSEKGEWLLLVIYDPLFIREI